MAALARLPESHPVIKDHKIFLRKRHNRWVGQTLTLYLNFSLVRGYLLQKPTFSNKRNRALLFSVGIKINTERPVPGDLRVIRALTSACLEMACSLLFGTEVLVKKSVSCSALIMFSAGWLGRILSCGASLRCG
jgi:hypothetical protein